MKRLSDDEVEELLDAQFTDLGEDEGVLVQPKGCSNTQLIRVCRRMGVVIHNQRKIRGERRASALREGTDKA